MVRRKIASGAASTDAQLEKGKRVVVQHDPVSEAVVIASAAQDPTIRATLVRRLRTDHFLVREHAAAWAALAEIERRKLAYSPDTVERAGGEDAARTISRCAEARPGVAPNLDWHVGNVLWDKVRADAVRGPIASLVEAVRDPTAEPARIRSLARHVGTSFEGGVTHAWLHEPNTLVREQMREVEARVGGRKAYPYGIDGLDLYESGRRRLVAGTAPGLVTVLTSCSGAGKSTVAANIVLGLLRNRRVLYGAWEMKGGMSLELMACIALGWSRSELMEGIGPCAIHEGRVALEEQMHELAKRVTFAGNPFRRRTSEKPSNDRNLDLVQGLVEDSGCEVFVADLWERCLADDDPKLEKQALFRQQAMAEETQTHHMLLAQQRIKDLEQRADKRPTREGIMGSSAWVGVADCILGIHRPALWKKVEDDRVEVLVLKQRYAPWPLAVEFDWAADFGRLSNGRSIDYDRPGEVSEFDQALGGGMGKFLNGGNNKRRGRA
jgi:hypothetical protein